MTKSQETMWHKQHKVIHSEVCQFGARGGPRLSSLKNKGLKRLAHHVHAGPVIIM